MRGGEPRGLVEENRQRRGSKRTQDAGNAGQKLAEETPNNAMHNRSSARKHNSAMQKCYVQKKHSEQTGHMHKATSAKA
ncbi:hypothetical protein KI387_004236, partial [Taxus chinensis]